MFHIEFATNMYFDISNCTGIYWATYVPSCSSGDQTFNPNQRSVDIWKLLDLFTRIPSIPPPKNVLTTKKRSTDLLSDLFILGSLTYVAGFTQPK